MSKKPDKKQQKESSEKSEEESPIKEKYRVDTAGTLFSLVSSPKIPCVYRFWATLKDLVKVDDLQQALDNILPRFLLVLPLLQLRRLFYNEGKSSFNYAR